MTDSKSPVIFQTKNGSIELSGDFANETIWASQKQIVELYGVDQSVISRHMRNVFRDGEIDEKSNMQKMHIANSDRPVTFYSLDVVLAVGYRTNSKVAIEFRKWATSVIRKHITEGYTINDSRVRSNYENFLKAVEGVKILLPANPDTIDAAEVLELIKAFAGTWFSLDAYDTESLPKEGITHTQVSVLASELSEAVARLKSDLVAKSQATDFFAQEKNPGTLTGIVGNVFQSFDGRDLYPSVEEKAAHLLYFIVKNHPFNDGNKRTGAFAFVWFLKKAGFPFRSKITPEALTVLTLLLAESDPKDKDRMVGLAILLLGGIPG